MKNPKPVNLSTKERIAELGWVADARDSDGHLISMQAWLKQCTPNENALMLSEFITEYATDCEITIYPENIN